MLTRSLLVTVSLLGLSSGLNRPQSPHKLVLVSRTLTASAPVTTSGGSSSSGSIERSVPGLCSAAQDSLGELKSAASSGISTLAQCGQFARDKGGSEAVYVSFNQVESDCMWFKDCQCLASSATCLGGDQWRSVAIADLLVAVPNTVIQTTSAPISKSALLSNGPSKMPSSNVESGQADSQDCDTTYSNSLMQSFQTKCEMAQNVWTTRLIAGIVLATVVFFVAGSFGVAYWFDQQELQAALAGK